MHLCTLIKLSSRSFAVTTCYLIVASVSMGCGQKNADSLVTSAKDYIAKKDFSSASIQLKSALQKKESGEVQYLLALTLVEMGDYAGAELQARRALLSKYSADAVYPVLAKAMLGLGEFKKITAELGKVVVSDAANQALITTIVGEAHLAQRQPAEAIALFDSALLKVPGEPRALIGRARAAVVSDPSGGSAADALKASNDILMASPTFAPALALKADLLIAQSKPAEAIEVLSKLVQAAPFNGQARFSLISLLTTENKFDEAANAINAMKKVAPRDIRPSYLSGVLALRKGEALKARDEAIKVLSAVPEHPPSLVLAGAAEYQLGSLSTAADYLRKALTANPENLYARNLLVAIYLRQGQPLKAEDALAPALKSAPTEPTVLRAAGEVALANNQLSEAAKYYAQALALEKNSVITQTRLAQIRLANGEVSDAVAGLETASSLDKDQYQADLSLVALYFEKRDFDKALTAIGALEKKQPNNPLTHNVRGAVYVGKRDIKAARLSFERALAIQANYLPAASNLARLDLAEKNPLAAKNRYEAIVAKDPTNDGALLALAQIQSLTSAAPAEVVATLDRAIKANPNSVQSRVALVSFHTKQADIKSALAAAQAATTVLPNEPRIIEALGSAQITAGEFNPAIETFNKLVRMQPESPFPLMRLASAQYAAKSVDAAIATLRKALAIKPDLLEAQREIIGAQIASGRADDALKEAKAIQKSRPTEAIGFAAEGDILSSQKKFAEAASAYAEGSKRQPLADVIARQYQMLVASGKATEANLLASKWIQANPKDTVVRFQIANELLGKKEYREASLRFKEIIAIQPSNFSVLNNLAWVLHEMKDASAIGYAEKAYAIAPGSAEVMDTFGWLLFSKGDVTRGMTLLKQAASASPRNLEVRLHLAKALIATGDKASSKKELEAIIGQGDKSPLTTEANKLLQSL
jgi:cellulose synthase operon protein C